MYKNETGYNEARFDAGSSATQTEASKHVGPISEAANKIRGILNLINSTNESLSLASERIQGPVPMGGADRVESQAIRSGELGEIHSLLDDLYAQVSRTSDLSATFARL